MFVSSTGFSIDLHYCQGNLKHFSFVGEAKSCHSSDKKDHCSIKKKSCHAVEPIMETVGNCKKDCCSNKTIVVVGNEDMKIIQSLEITPLTLKFITAYVHVFLSKKINAHKVNIPFLNYIPPLLTKDIPVLIQSFLI